MSDATGATFGFADQTRLRHVLATFQLDGLLATKPESFHYFSGAAPGPVALMWRRAGPVSAIVSPDDIAFVTPDMQAGAVAAANPGRLVAPVTVWIERVDVDPAAPGDAATLVAQACAGQVIQRPETYEWAAVIAQLRAAIAHLGFTGQRVGVEMDAAPASDVERLRAGLAPTRLVDSTAAMQELRAIKTPPEIDRIRQAVELTEFGVRAVVAEVDRRLTAPAIATRFGELVAAEARRRELLAFERAATTVHLGPRLWGRGDPRRTAQAGDLLQFDSATRFGGYNSDIGRTFTLGPPTDRQRQIGDALLAGFAAGEAELRPGRAFRDAFEAVHRAVRANGFPSYTRGHVGHSIGGDLAAEEWPFFSATEHRTLEPGMVVAFEVPYYLDGIGGFQNENNYLITSDGHVSLNQLPMVLGQVEW